MRIYAGDLEVGDVIQSGTVLRHLSTGTGNPAEYVVEAKGMHVLLVRDAHPSDPERICFKGPADQFFDLHRAKVIKIIG